MARFGTRTREIAIVFVCAACFVPTLSTADETSAVVSPLGVVVRPPDAERRAIKIPTGVVSPIPETWNQVESGLPPGLAKGAAASFGRPERWVRNVSQPTLAVFLPKVVSPSRSAFIVVPGGGFMQLAIDREGYSVAQWLNKQGIVAFVLKYRLAPLPSDANEYFRSIVAVSEQVKNNLAKSGPVTVANVFPEAERDALIAGWHDALWAVGYVREHAAAYGVSRSRIGIMGFSAGAAIAIASAAAANLENRPDLIATIYGLVPDQERLPSSMPPAFIAAAANDVWSPQSLDIYSNWQKADASAELHIFDAGHHGFGVIRQGTSSDQWLALFALWLNQHDFCRLVAGRTQ